MVTSPYVKVKWAWQHEPWLRAEKIIFNYLCNREPPFPLLLSSSSSSFSPSLDLLGLRDSRFVVRLLAEIIVENVDFRTKFMKIKILTGPSLGRNTNTLGEILFLGGNL